jgi:hypothetical protein
LLLDIAITLIRTNVERLYLLTDSIAPPKQLLKAIAQQGATLAAQRAVEKEKAPAGAGAKVNREETPKKGGCGVAKHRNATKLVCSAQTRKFTLT